MYPPPTSPEAQVLVAEIDRVQREIARREKSATLGWLQLCMGAMLTSLMLGYLLFNWTSDDGPTPAFLVPCILVFNALHRGARDRLACTPYPPNLLPRWLGGVPFLNAALWIALVVATAVSFFSHLPLWLACVFAAVVGSACFVPGLASLRRAGTLRAHWSSQPRGPVVHTASLVIAVILALSVGFTGVDAKLGLLFGQLIPLIGFLIWGFAYTAPWGPNRVGARWRGSDWAAFTLGVVVLAASSVATNRGAEPGHPLRLALAAAAALPLVMVTLWDISHG